MTWRGNCRAFIAEIHAELGPAATLEDRIKALRSKAGEFHGGTSWGKRIWGQESRAYLARFGQALPRAKSPRLLAAMERGDIIFPFRGGGNNVQDRES